MKTILSTMLGIFLLVFETGVTAGDLECIDKNTGKKYTSTTSYFACNYPNGNCTWWAAYMRPDLAEAGITGNAQYWYDNAKRLGFSVDSKSMIGAVAVFSNPSHVAYVTDTHGDGSFDVSEMDATGRLGRGVQYATYYPDGNGKYHRNNGAVNGWTLKGFIYRKGAEGEVNRVIPEVNVLPTEGGSVVYEGPNCLGSTVWKGKSTSLVPYRDAASACEPLFKDTYITAVKAPEPSPSLFQRMKAAIWNAVRDGWRDAVSGTKNFFTLAQTAQAAGVSPQTFAARATMKVPAILYKDGTLCLMDGSVRCPVAYASRELVRNLPQMTDVQIAPPCRPAVESGMYL